MGFIIGRNFRVEGLFARLMYRSLYKMHEYALHGGRWIFLAILAPRLVPPAPSRRSKLH